MLGSSRLCSVVCWRLVKDRVVTIILRCCHLQHQIQMQILSSALNLFEDDRLTLDYLVCFSSDLKPCLGWPCSDKNADYQYSNKDIALFTFMIIKYHRAKQSWLTHMSGHKCHSVWAKCLPDDSHHRSNLLAATSSKRHMKCEANIDTINSYEEQQLDPIPCR